MKNIKKILNICSSFLVDNLGALAFYLVILTLSSYIFSRADGSIGFYETGLPLGISHAVLPATFCAIIRGLLLIIPKNRKLIWFPARSLAGIITSFVIIISGIEIWLKINIQSRWSDTILRLIYETTSSETEDFLSVYVFTTRSLLTLLCFSAAAFLLYFFLVKWKTTKMLIDRSLHSLRVKTTVLILIIAANIWSIYIRFDANFMVYPDSYTQFHRSVNSFGIYLLSTDDYKSAISEIDSEFKSDSDHPQIIIWVIGESESRFHLQLYGYGKPTTPNLMSEYSRGNILRFDSVETSSSCTSIVMEYIYSPALPNTSITDRRKTPLLPMLMRHAGYQVRLFDNQLPPNGGRGEWYEFGFCNFLQSKFVKKVSFDYMSDTVCALDNEFVDRMLPMLTNGKSPRIDIIHLWGEHFDSSRRFSHTPEKLYFDAEDYAYRKDLNAKQRQTIADYDNAVRNVDAIMAKIFQLVNGKDAIVVYTSDHGELVFDVDGRSGRTGSAENDERTAPYIFNVPFYIYSTPEFRKSHPMLYERLKASTARPFSLTHFSHLMLDLGGVKTRFTNDAYSPLSPDYIGIP